MTNNNPRPLDGIRVIEVGQLLAGPFTGTMLGYYGAEVIKIETPGDGDPIRKWRIMKDGQALWWHSLARNKKCVTANLRTDEGRDLVRQLAETADVIVENFRPGTMEKWGLGPDELRAANPGLIYARISGYGQTGPYDAKPGFASVCEGFGTNWQLSSTSSMPSSSSSVFSSHFRLTTGMFDSCVMFLRSYLKIENCQMVKVTIKTAQNGFTISTTPSKRLDL